MHTYEALVLVKLILIVRAQNKLENEEPNELQILIDPVSAILGAIVSQSLRNTGKFFKDFAENSLAIICFSLQVSQF